MWGTEMISDINTDLIRNINSSFNLNKNAKIRHNNFSATFCKNYWCAPDQISSTFFSSICVGTRVTAAPFTSLNCLQEKPQQECEEENTRVF